MPLACWRDINGLAAKSSRDSSHSGSESRNGTPFGTACRREDGPHRERCPAPPERDVAGRRVRTSSQSGFGLPAQASSSPSNHPLAVLCRRCRSRSPPSGHASSTCTNPLGTTVTTCCAEPQLSPPLLSVISSPQPLVGRTLRLIQPGQRLPKLLALRLLPIGGRLLTRARRGRGCTRRETACLQDKAEAHASGLVEEVGV